MEGKSLLDNIFRRIRLNKLENETLSKSAKFNNPAYQTMTIEKQQQLENKVTSQKKPYLTTTNAQSMQFQAISSEQRQRLQERLKFAHPLQRHMIRQEYKRNMGKLSQSYEFGPNSDRKGTSFAKNFLLKTLSGQENPTLHSNQTMDLMVKTRVSSPRVNAPSYYTGHLNENMFKMGKERNDSSSHHFKGFIKGVKQYKEMSTIGGGYESQLQRRSPRFLRRKQKLLKNQVEIIQLHDQETTAENLYTTIDRVTKSRVLLKIQVPKSQQYDDKVIQQRMPTNQQSTKRVNSQVSSYTRKIVPLEKAQGLKMLRQSSKKSNNSPEKNKESETYRLSQNNQLNEQKALCKQSLVHMLLKLQRSKKFQNKQQIKQEIANNKSPLMSKQRKKIGNRFVRIMSPVKDNERFLSPIGISHDACEKSKAKQYDSQVEKLQVELFKSQQSQLIDIISPKVSQQAGRLIKQRMKTKKIIETRHNIDYNTLMKGYEIFNPAKRIKENLNQSNEVKGLLYGEFEAFKQWKLNLRGERILDYDDGTFMNFSNEVVIGGKQ
ncbi:UNKNOWN [Stylonychia lemnae]|uniref:Uncharacterized protein n=1 Tax=Stylonychia lemnae TaxID=5949 RepID=A0A078AFS4_STYLE|nr:UNKNOWN [Stylonychia lemnae]|eukprot:CDW80691.1 UNKNOWN [Stylonychia lemnae]